MRTVDPNASSPHRHRRWIALSTAFGQAPSDVIWYFALAPICRFEVFVESVVPLIEAAFTQRLAVHGFGRVDHASATANFLADIVVYQADRRRVTVTYAPSREAWCEVSIAGYGEPQPVSDLFSFVNGVDGMHEQYRATRDPEAFGAEAKRCCDLLVHYCGEFLRGDMLAFRRRYRELFLVAHVATSRDTAKAAGDHRTAAWYDLWLRDYRHPLPG